MKAIFKGRFIWAALTAFIILSSTALLSVSLFAAHQASDKRVVTQNSGESIENYRPEIIFDEEIPGLYHDGQSLDLMPIDLTLTKTDIPELLEKISLSAIGAVYADNQLQLLVTDDGQFQISRDNGLTWEEYTAEAVNTEEFAIWLLKNDPNPGYSMEEMQTRLKNGATVSRLFVDSNLELYCIQYADGIQLELVQEEKQESALLDHQRMMITSTSCHPYRISKDILKTLYDMMVKCQILTQYEADIDYKERIDWLNDNLNFEFD